MYPTESHPSPSPPPPTPAAHPVPAHPVATLRSRPARRTLIHVGPHHWVLEPGQSVSFGRGSPCDIQIAHDPIDDHVSRRAGVVKNLGDDVIVRNESATRMLIFSPARGVGQVIQPGEAITCRPHREFLVALPGRSGSHYVLQVTAGLPAED